MNLKDKIKTSLLDVFRKQDGTINYSSASKSIGVSRQAIMGWCNGTVNVYEIKLENLLKTAKATKRPIEWFLNQEENETKEPQGQYLSKKIQNKYEKQELIDKLNTLLKNESITDETLKEIVGYLKIKTSENHSNLIF